jgi:hypothetical protein
VVADGTDEDGARATRMDEWVVWETVERAAPGARVKLFFSFPFFSFVFPLHFFCKGARIPSLAHNALPRAEDFLCSSSPTEGQ